MSSNFDNLQSLKYQDLRKIAKELGIKPIGKAGALIKTIMAETSQVENKENLPELPPSLADLGAASESEASPNLAHSTKSNKQGRRKTAEVPKNDDNKVSPTTPKSLPITSPFALLGSTKHKSSLQSVTPAGKSSSSRKLSLRKKSTNASLISKNVSVQFIPEETLSHNESNSSNNLLTSTKNKSKTNKSSKNSPLSPKDTKGEETELENSTSKLETPEKLFKKMPRLRRSIRFFTPQSKDQTIQSHDEPSSLELNSSKKIKKKAKSKKISPISSKDPNVQETIELPLNTASKLRKSVRLSMPQPKDQTDTFSKDSIVNSSNSDLKGDKDAFKSPDTLHGAVSSPPKDLAKENTFSKLEEVNISVRRRKVRSQYYGKHQEEPSSEAGRKDPPSATVIEEPDLTETSHQRSSRQKMNASPAKDLPTHSMSLRRMTQSLSPISRNPDLNLSDQEDKRDQKDILNSTMTLDKDLSTLPHEVKKSRTPEVAKIDHKNKKGPSPRITAKSSKPEVFFTNSKPRAIITPKFSKIHQRNFEKMESLDQYVNRKKKALAKVSKIPKLLPSQGKVKEMITPAKAPPTFVPSIFSAKKIQTNFAELAHKTLTSSTVKSSKRKAASKKTLNTPASKPLNSSKVFKFEGSQNPNNNSFLNSSFHIRQSFDVKASLSRKLNYKPHKGPLQPLNTSVSKPSSVATRKREEYREVLKGVAKNKRFLLQMNHRNHNTSIL